MLFTVSISKPLLLQEMCIIREMFRAEVEPMPSNLPDRLARSGVWKVAIYEDERFGDDRDACGQAQQSWIEFK